MPINHADGQFGLDCWLDPNSENESDETEYSDNIDELRARAQILLKGGRYRHLVLYHWNATKDEWDEIDSYP